MPNRKKGNQKRAGQSGSNDRGGNGKVPSTAKRGGKDKSKGAEKPG